MTKVEMIRNVAREASITNSAAELAVNRVRDIIVDKVMTTGRFAMDGVGVFTLVERAARQGRNPQTGEAVKIPARKTIKFRPARSFREAVK